jgi:hypothetical protein
MLEAAGLRPTPPGVTQVPQSQPAENSARPLQRRLGLLFFFAVLPSVRL